MGKRGWLNLTFGEICLSLLTGGTPDTSIAKYWSGSVPWITGADFLNQKIAEPRRYITEEAVHRSNTRIIKAGNLLVVTRTGVGKIAIAPFDIAVSQDTTGVYFHENISVDFMFYCIQSQIEELKKLNQGTSINGILKADLLALALTIPESFAEQQKIAEILSTIDRAIEQTEAIIAKQQRIKTGLMQDLLTKGIDEDGNVRSEATHKFKDSPLGRIPVEWEVEKLDSLLIEKRYGISTSLSEDPIGIPVLRMNNLVKGEIDFTDLKYSEREDARKLTLDDGDVLFNRTNSIDYVGRTAIYRYSGKPVSFASYLVRLVPDNARLCPEYLNLCLNDGENQIRVKQFATIGVQQANVNPTNLGTLLLAIPQKITEQKQIIEDISASIDCQRDTNTNLRKLQSLKIGLMQDLLTGNVRVTALLNDQEIAKI